MKIDNYLNDFIQTFANKFLFSQQNCNFQDEVKTYVN